jgi:heterodisulfide reductase subunit A
MTDSILIVGGGITGLHAALECAGAGAGVIVVERGPVVGGRLAAPMTNATAIGNRAEGIEIPVFEALAGNDKIEILTNSTLEKISGGPGNFTVSIRERARFVTDACTRCKLCHTACPVVRPNEFDAGLTFRKAIYTPMGETLPAPYVIDIDSCLNTPPNYLPCNRCIEVCEDDAIFFDLPLQTAHERHVGAVILAPGFRIEDSNAYKDLGFGLHPDILTSAELQRLLESPGPTGGYASKPSNEEYPESVLLVLDELSPFGLYIVASQARQLLEQDVETVAVLVLSQPGSGPGFEEAQQLAEATGISVGWGTMFKVDANADGVLEVSYEDFSAQRFVKASYDMVVLCTDVEPPAGIDELARAADVGLADTGYLAVTQSNGVGIATTQKGIFVAGCASGAKNIKDSIAEAHAAASAALAQLDPRVLGGDAAESPASGTAKTIAPEVAADLQGQIEKLLHALLERPGG